MAPLLGVRDVLKAIAEVVEVLPAVGGAVEDLERPDFEEREDQALNQDEKVFETVFERDPSGAPPRLYRPVPPLGRPELHLFRYFLDGSFRSYFLGTVLEHDRESPVHFAQIGACVLRREDDGTVRKQALEVKDLLLLGRQRLSEEVWGRLEGLTARVGVRLVDLTGRDVISDVLSDFDLRNKAGGKVRYEMRRLEAELIRAALPALSRDAWLIADGSLQFDPILTALGAAGDIQPVVGVAKNFRKDPSSSSGAGPGPSAAPSTSSWPTFRPSTGRPHSRPVGGRWCSGMCVCGSRDTWTTP
jgi:hypothetical protein